METYLTTNEVAAHYRTVDSTVRGWRRRGYGPRGALVGGQFLYPRSEVARFDLELAGRGGYVVAQDVA